jgi:hypothetical protein
MAAKKPLEEVVGSDKAATVQLKKGILSDSFEVRDKDDDHRVARRSSRADARTEAEKYVGNL